MWNPTRGDARQPGSEDLASVKASVHIQRSRVITWSGSKSRSISNKRSDRANPLSEWRLTCVSQGHTCSLPHLPRAVGGKPCPRGLPGLRATELQTNGGESSRHSQEGTC